MKGGPDGQVQGRADLRAAVHPQVEGAGARVAPRPYYEFVGAGLVLAPLPSSQTPGVDPLS